MKGWVVGGARVKGASHEKTKDPCQDFFSVHTSADREWAAIVVSDGAGSARHSETSAKQTSDQFCQSLLELSNELKLRAPGAWVNDFLILKLVSLRQSLRTLANSDDLSDYHCTLVGALLGPKGGVVVHIGDGAILSGFAETRENGVIDLSKTLNFSAPENGEYANETFFITESDWIKHLRVRPVPATNWLVAGSDGGVTLILGSGHSPKPELVTNVIASARGNDDSSLALAVERLINSELAKKLTSDDRTLVVALRDAALLDGQFIYSENSLAPEGETPVRSPATAPPQGNELSPKGSSNAPIFKRPKESKLGHSKMREPAKLANFLLVIISLVSIVLIIVAFLTPWRARAFDFDKQFFKASEVLTEQKLWHHPS
jgi:hypothetical protein